MSKLLIAVDYDGTFSSAPKLFTIIGKALRKSGHHVVVLTANEHAQAALNDAGYHKAYDSVEVVDGKNAADIADAKAKWLKKNNADLLIDNNALNVSAAVQVTNAAQFIPKNTTPETKSQRPANVSVGVVTHFAAHRRSTTDTAA